MGTNNNYNFNINNLQITKKWCWREKYLKESQDNVLVTDSVSLRGDLLVVRSLRKRKIKTTTMVQDYWTPAMFSRWKPEKAYAPASTDNPKGFIKSLIKLVKTKKYCTIFPTCDPSLIPISENREKLTQYVNLTLPSHKSLMKTIDKTETLKLAKKIGVPTPKTFYIKTKSDIKDIAPKIQYPVVIKPKRSWEFKNKAYFSHPFYANSASELVSTYAKVEKSFPQAMIQEYIPGYNLQVGLIFDQGKPMAACAIKEHRTFPITGGLSVLRETIKLNPRILEYACSLLKSLNWHGIAEVEFRVDSRDFNPKLMEINARFWGSMNAAIKSGIDFPYMLYLLAKGEKINPIFSYKTGIKYRMLPEDIKNFQHTLKNNSNLAQVQPINKLKAILNFLKIYEPNLNYDGLTIYDPLPFFMTNAFFTFENSKDWIKQKIRPKNSVNSP